MTGAVAGAVWLFSRALVPCRRNTEIVCKPLRRIALAAFPDVGG
jgi:hypothetical protein